MSILLVPVPIVHAQGMLDDLAHGHSRFAFGSNALDFFERAFSTTCEAEGIPIYIYVSKTGQKELKSPSSLQLGVFVKGRLCGWSKADRRGLYLKEARRPASCSKDGPMSLFWEIDNIERLPKRMPISNFSGDNTLNQFADDYVPQGPILVKIR